ncbi:MAG: hypothetical protein ACLQU4_06470 [Limisphaerales bacterium]
MKSLFHIALFCLAVALICGCASRHSEPVYHAGDENPPDFLVGPTMVVLTNLNGFSAHVTSTVSSPGEPPRAMSGELLGREGRLVYQPTLAIKGKRARLEGGLFFIWDETRHSGYVMSEALQGYAPVKSQIGPAAQLTITKDGITEEIDGHPCHRCQAVVTFQNGLQAHLTLWEADDAGHFPVRIETAEGPSRMTLDFAEIRLESPPQEVFMPPDGFTPYASSVALMNELIVRDANFARKHQIDENSEPVDQTGNYHPMPGVNGMAHP